MRRYWRLLGITCALVTVTPWPPGGERLRAELGGQNSTAKSARGGIVVDGTAARAQLAHIPVSIRIRARANPVNLTITVESLSTARFEDLPAGEYVIEMLASGLQPAGVDAKVADGETTQVSVEVAESSTPTIVLKLRRPDLAPQNGAGSESDLAGGSAATPKADMNSSCPIDEVIQKTSKREEEFVENVNRITAVEVLEHERLDKHGKLLESERHRYNYVAVIEETMPGALNVDEYRDGSGGASGFPRDMATLGMPSLAMIFHPYHLTEFEITCEGSSVWHDRTVWQVHFQQRKDKPARMSIIRVGNQVYPVLLKGSAWIDAESYQIAHLETDLLEPIPQAKLSLEHQALNYGPVLFEKHKLALWLPQEAEIYLDSGGRKFHHRHTYSKYQIFSVDVGQKIGDPKPN